MDPSAVLPICSITKQFTAVAIQQLVEAGRLKLTDDLAKWVPDYPAGGTKVTLAQLLSNLSGIPSVEEQPEWRKSWESESTPNQVLDFTRNKALDFAPVPLRHVGKNHLIKITADQPGTKARIGCG